MVREGGKKGERGREGERGRNGERERKREEGGWGWRSRILRMLNEKERGRGGKEHICIYLGSITNRRIAIINALRDINRLVNIRDPKIPPRNVSHETGAPSAGIPIT